jgi:hypothetical protein
MRRFVFSALAVLALPVGASGSQAILNTKVIEGSFEQVVCISSGTLSVRSDDLERVLFTVRRGELVKVYQGWGDVRKTKVIGGVTYIFMKVQFPSREHLSQSDGWVAEMYIKPRSQCPGLEDSSPPADPRPITGINDPRCCVFPLTNRPLVNYSSGVASFGANRGGGSRRHAASDLYRAKDDPIRAVTDGQVIRGLYFFYQGTYAIELRHSGGFVVRYGEISGRSTVGQGASVRAGQTVGFMGKTTCCQPMLHFELYSGSGSGPLSVGGNIYQRRSDLLNPTAHLQRWQDNTLR